MARVTIKDLTKRFGNVVAVHGMNLEIADREFLVLLGPSGAGKTTTLRCVAGLEKPTGGSVAFAGVELAPLRGRALRDARRQLQMVFQDPYASLDPRQRVAAIVGEPLRVRWSASAARPPSACRASSAAASASASASPARWRRSRG